MFAFCQVKMIVTRRLCKFFFKNNKKKIMETLLSFTNVLDVTALYVLKDYNYAVVRWISFSKKPIKKALCFL